MTDTVAVIFAGQSRGSTTTWTNLRDRLIRPHGADVFAVFWRSRSVACFADVMRSGLSGVVDIRELDAVAPTVEHLHTFFGPLDSSAPVTPALKNHSASAKRPRATPARRQPGGVLPFKTETCGSRCAEYYAKHIIVHYGKDLNYPWLQYFLVHKAFALVAHTAHSILVRVRSDATFDVNPVPLTRLFRTNAVHLEPGKFETKWKELAMYWSLEKGGPYNASVTKTPTCGYMPNDSYVVARK